MTKVLVVDDSALMRRQISRILTEAGLEVTIARNGVEALESVSRDKPDVITLDINMPEMDGLTFLSQLMVERPTPVVMVSSLTEQGALATFEALELGAVDFVHKPDGTVSHNIDQVRNEIVGKVQAAARARIRRSRGLRERLAADRSRIEARPTLPSPAVRLPPLASDAVVLIGVSTGGPSTLEAILTALPGDFPCPIVIAQHMPATFTTVFARRLNEVCELTVQEVTQPQVIEAGHVYIGRGDADLHFVKRGRSVVAAVTPPSPNWFWHPSVDCMVDSAMKVFAPSRLIGVLLTGMGNDGARKMADLHAAGGRTIAESEETAVVFGMPQELINLGGADLVLPFHGIARQIIDWTAPTKRAGRIGT